MSRIQSVHAREVLDSRGKPTVEVDVACQDGSCGRAIVPSGASKGRAEAIEIRDVDAERYDGDGVTLAIQNVHRVIRPAILGWDVVRQFDLDERLLDLDGTSQKEQLGANAILGVSMAVAHAAAASTQSPLHAHFRRLADALGIARPSTAGGFPLPMTNMISGGLHAGQNLDLQDVLIQPVGAPNYPVGLEWTVRVYRRLGALLRENGFEGQLVGDEGGYGPRLKSNEQALEFVVRAIELAGLKPGTDCTLALDVAASHFYCEGQYVFETEKTSPMSGAEMVALLTDWCNRYPIASLEDGLAEDDWPAWQHLQRVLGDRVMLVGDDLFATNVTRLQRGIALRAANAVLVKMNQVGTVTETLKAILVARNAGLQTVVSARSGETEDTTMCDLAVGAGAEHIKIGCVARGERLAKYNQLLRIAEQLPKNESASFLES